MIANRPYHEEGSPPQPSLAVAENRNKLVKCLGRLLAKHWLESRQPKGSQPTSGPTAPD